MKKLKKEKNYENAKKITEFNVDRCFDDNFIRRNDNNGHRLCIGTHIFSD